jgi:hypothetical protein
MLAGGYVATSASSVPDANAISIPQSAAEQAFDLVTCIGYDACASAKYGGGDGCGGFWQLFQPQTICEYLSSNNFHLKLIIFDRSQSSLNPAPPDSIINTQPISVGVRIELRSRCCRSR